MTQKCTISQAESPSVLRAGEAPAKPLTQSSFPDLEKLRLGQNFAEQVGVKKAFLTIPIRRPSNQEFVRVHPDDSMAFQTVILEVKEDRESYLVAPDLWSEIPTEVKPTILFVAINRQKVLTLWPVKLPDSSGRRNAWGDSLLEAAQLAKSVWIRVVANMSLGAYDIFRAVGNLSEPEWPDLSLQQILEIAFKDRYISTPDHPVLNRLAGSV